MDKYNELQEAYEQLLREIQDIESGPDFDPLDVMYRAMKIQNKEIQDTLKEKQEDGPAKLPNGLVRLPEQVRNKYPSYKESTFFGVPAEALDRDSLLAMIGSMIDTTRQEKEFAKRSDTLMSDLEKRIQG